MKKVVSLLLSLALCFSLIPSVFAVETVSADNKFTDVPKGAWYLSDLNYALANGYISGTSDNTFSPEGNITRGQFVTILGRMLGVSATDGTTKFSDVASNSYYAPYVGWAAQHGYVNGTSDTTFAPESLITFEQMGTILANFITKSGATLSGCTPSATYKDESSISAYAVESMEMMRAYGLIHTDSSGNVRPQTPVNRAEGTVSLVRLAKATGRGEVPTIKEPEPPAPEYQKGDGWKVTYQWCKVYKNSLDKISYHAMIEVENTGNQAIYLKQASVDFEDANGRLIASGDSMSTAYSVVLPGEKGYFYEHMGRVSGNLTENSKYVFAPQITIVKSKEQPTRYEISELQLTKSNNIFLNFSIVGRIKNQTKEDESYVSVKAVLFDRNKKPMAVCSTSVTSLTAGSKQSFDIGDLLLSGLDITIDDIADYKVVAEEMYFQFSW